MKSMVWKEVVGWSEFQNISEEILAKIVWSLGIYFWNFAKRLMKSGSVLNEMLVEAFLFYVVVVFLHVILSTWSTSKR